MREKVDPTAVLVEDPDPLHRSRAHTELGFRAAARHDVDRAVWHFREAVDLDPTDEKPRQALHGLGKLETEPQPQATLFSRLLRGIRRVRTA